MSVLRTLFDLNRPIFVFGYALVYFVLGLSIAVQSRRSSRLELARGLAWLAAFGIAQSLYEWGEFFAPVQEAYLGPFGALILHDLHLLTLCVSFVCLFEFGVALLRPLGRGRWLHRVTLGLLIVYFLIVVIVLPRFSADPHHWHRTAEALARYLIAFPAGLLAAYGLREQTFRHIAPLDVPPIVRTLRAAGIALALYAVFGGLLPPAVSFFPGNVINASTFEAALGFPPLVFQALIALVLAFTIIRALEVFDLETERRIEAMEQAQILTAERERWGRELHDGAIQAVYTAGLLVESARRLAEPGTPIASRLEKTEAALNDAIRDLRRSLGELRAAPSGEPLKAALRRLAEDPRYRSLVNVRLELDLPDSDCLAPTRTQHVLAIVNEALSNVVRHARARQVSLTARHAGGRLRLAIQDDGVGLPRETPAGYGLRNMRDRARLLEGQITIGSGDGKGTTVTLDIPWSET